MAEVEGTADIDGMQSIQISGGGLQQITHVADAGVVDQDVERRDLFGKLGYGGGIADVELGDFGLAACLADGGDRGVAGGRIAINDPDGGTLTGEELSNGLADTGSCAGNEGGFMIETKHGVMVG